MISIICACITGVFAVLGVVITNIAANKKTERQIEKSQAVTDCKIEELTREVREHNNFAKRIPIVEKEIEIINKQIDNMVNNKK